MLEEKIQKLSGPILVLGASGFVGSHLFRTLRKVRPDVYGVASRLPQWRLEGLPVDSQIACDLLIESHVRQLLEKVQPQTVFDCVAYGAYSFQEQADLIYKTNFDRVVFLVQQLRERHCTYIHSGSSSEYGEKSAAPSEEVFLTPNSHYAVSKAAVSELLYYMGKKEGLRCANLRLYSVYGPFEDSSRLIPRLLQKALSGTYPPLVDPEISRDFVYLEDVGAAYIEVALNLREDLFGESYNVGTGQKTSIRELAEKARALFQIPTPPVFSDFENRRWDVKNWVACCDKIQSQIGWKAKVTLEQGLLQTAQWLKGLSHPEAYERASKKFSVIEKDSISAIIACYKDAQAIPLLYERLSVVFQKIRVDYEILFINDCSPDDSEEVIRRLTEKDPRVKGVSHSRNFGSQSAFRSGMEIASKKACVLLDGDLQDPPELIEAFYQKWKEGYEVVYGRRVKREATLFMQVAYKAFYYLFERFSYIPIPRDAGDFSLMDRKVVQALLRFPERDLFVRGIRAFVGFRQTGVDYVRPERLFGRSTNNLFKNLGWAKKGILSFSHTPLNALSVAGVGLFFFSLVLALLQMVSKLFWPSSAPAGITTVLVVIIFFGSINLLGLSLLGEYLAKVFEEVKKRPHFVRKSMIQDGKCTDAF